MPNRDEVKGKIDQAAGTVKEHVGRATGDGDLEARGAAQKAGGDIREGFGEAKRKVGEVVKDIGDSIKKS